MAKKHFAANPTWPVYYPPITAFVTESDIFLLHYEFLNKSQPDILFLLDFVVQLSKLDIFLLHFEFLTNHSLCSSMIGYNLIYSNQSEPGFQLHPRRLCTAFYSQLSIATLDHHPSSPSHHVYACVGAWLVSSPAFAGECISHFVALDDPPLL